jgi:hypothetical protein
MDASCNKKKDHIDAAVRSRMKQKGHRFGFEILRTVQRALEFDRETRTDFWCEN